MRPEASDIHQLPTAPYRGAAVTITIIFIVGFASLVFFSTILIVAALMLRGHWDDLANHR